MMSEQPTIPIPYDRTYFEHGVERRVSGYTNYHWRPEYVLPLANTIKELFGDATTLDFGCAKGYLVKALRLLGVNAYGYDISQYAIDNADPDVKEFVWPSLTDAGVFHTVIAKDVLEHVPHDQMEATLKLIHSHACRNLFVVVPLGDNGTYRIREYELDATHQIREDEVWWIKAFNRAGFETVKFHYALPGVKEHWTSRYPTGNGIFILKKLPPTCTQQ